MVWHGMIWGKTNWVSRWCFMVSWSSWWLVGIASVVCVSLSLCPLLLRLFFPSLPSFTFLSPCPQLPMAPGCPWTMKPVRHGRELPGLSTRAGSRYPSSHPCERGGFSRESGEMLEVFAELIRWRQQTMLWAKKYACVSRSLLRFHWLTGNKPGETSLICTSTHTHTHTSICSIALELELEVDTRTRLDSTRFVSAQLPRCCSLG
ncbi:hypothetical protein BKA64DRAFT_191753 [Cadophora sp. MPI-SDFR-AT-0126]|nr:hypothetical protein BKA64DRAFT_191753 [Leotiomycetes sp. MPI-SDFR-AT-0126]